MALHETVVVCKLDGVQLEGHALLLRSHGERRDRGCRVNLAGVGVGGRIGLGSCYSVEGTVTQRELEIWKVKAST